MDSCPTRTYCLIDHLLKASARRSRGADSQNVIIVEDSRCTMAKQQAAAHLLMIVPVASACTGLLLYSIYNHRAQEASQELIWLLDGNKTEFRQAETQLGL